MKKTTALDLSDVCDAMESLVKGLPKMTRQERIDVCARIRAVTKAAKTIDDSVKSEIKKYLFEEEGDVLGEIFKAHLGVSPATRLVQDMLKTKYPKIYDECCETKDEIRITFSPR